ncbi:hypothetical protein C4585_02745 [Candidatus Parcubacteria bacterium]|nr:MAG: hypothetical protein C4585_02745 [Candidatus Parcubacteria bacterium]
MTLDRANSFERRTKTDVIKAGVFVAALVAGHEHAEAAEISADISWEQGAVELERSVKEDLSEVAITFALYRDGTYEWLPMQQGNEKNVYALPSSEIAAALSGSRGKQVEKICDLHTHNSKAIEKMYSEYFGSSIVFDGFVPPGIGPMSDLTTARVRSANISKDAREYEVDVGTFTAGVFDARGVWYFRVMEQSEEDQHADVRKVDEQELQYLSSEFTMAAMKPDFDFETAYKKLIEVYRTQAHAIVRFVPYDQLQYEPPCAGPDYEPEKER